MVAPALVGAVVPAGTHVVAFRFKGYAGYPYLFAVSLLTMALLLGAEVRRRLKRARLGTALGPDEGT